MWLSKGIQYPALPSCHVGEVEESTWYKNVFGAFLTDLSKAFDSLPHDLIIAKLNVYGFPALNLMQNYLANRKQSTKINDSFNLSSYMLFGVHQGSILGPFLFNLFLSNLCLKTTLNGSNIYIQHFLVMLDGIGLIVGLKF